MVYIAQMAFRLTVLVYYCKKGVVVAKENERREKLRVRWWLGREGRGDLGY